MKIVLVGAGEVGFSVAKSLSQDGHDLVVVEENEDRAYKAEQELDVMLVRGNGARPQVLERAGVHPDSGVDLLIACTNRDEVNILACWVARRMGIHKVIARAVGLEFTDTGTWAKDLGIDLMISPERSVAREVEELLQIRSAVHATELLAGKAGLYVFRIAPDSPACEVPLHALRRMYPNLITLVAFIDRGGTGFVPRAEDSLREGDLCYSVCYRDQVEELEQIFQPRRRRKLRRVFLVGGGKVGFQVARLLEHRGGVDVRLLDQDRGKCKRLSQELERTTVLWGDGADEDLLRHEGIEDADGFVAATGEDEKNLLLAVLGKHLGAAKSIAVVKRHSYLKMADRLPLDAVVNRNLALSEGIIRNVRYPAGSKVLAVLDQIGAETLEVTLPETSPAVGVSLQDLPLPQGVLLGIVIRGEEAFIPTGATLLQAGDRAVLFAATHDMPDAVRILGVEEA